MPKDVEIVFQPEGKRVIVPAGTNLLEASRETGLGISSVCGGKGVCGKCKVVIWGGREELKPITPLERKHLTEEELDAGFRLACQAEPHSDLVVEVPMSSRTGRQRLQTEGVDVKIEPVPLIEKCFVKLNEPTITAIDSDEDLLLKALEERHGLRGLKLDYDVLKSLPGDIRNDWTVTAVVWGGKRVIAVEAGDTVDRCFGLALDIGTTKMAGFLVDLKTGAVRSISSIMNPQIPYGEDIITRISYVKENPDGLRELQKIVVDGVNNMIEDCCKLADVDQNEVYEVVAVGNTAMHHLFLGISPVSVALAPYAPVARRGIDVGSDRLGVMVHPKANIHFMPNIGGFVGADNVGVILSTRLLDSEETSMCLDIGTNTEVVLGNSNGLVTCSCASGPAFEGAHIKHGMRAATGAIESVTIDPETLDISYQTIDDSPPVGICGSGLVDTLAELLKSGIIDSTGRINNELKTRRLKKGTKGMEFVIAPRDETQNELDDIVITQMDIRELQKGKAAIHTGSEILMKNRKIDEGQIDRLLLAGAFGSYIEPESARLIGMFPEIPLEKVRIVGNAAGVGARLALISEDERNKAEDISQNVGYVELAAIPSFQEEYMKSLFLPYQDLSRYPLTTKLLNGSGRTRWSRLHLT